MKTINNTFDKLDAFAQKMANGFTDLLCKIGKIRARTNKFEKLFVDYVRDLVLCCVAIAHGAFNLAVKLSIIAIAMIMLYNFAQANPELAIQINDVVMNAYNTVRESVIQSYNIFVDAIHMPFRLFAELIH